MRNVQNRLSHADYFVLCCWLQKYEMGAKETAKSLAEAAALHMERPITIQQVRDAMKSCDLKLPEVVELSQDEKITILGKGLAQLYKSLGVTLPEELINLTK